jgi:hypothetical protein
VRGLITEGNRATIGPLNELTVPGFFRKRRFHIEDLQEVDRELDKDTGKVATFKFTFSGGRSCTVNPPAGERSAKHLCELNPRIKTIGFPTEQSL